MSALVRVGCSYEILVFDDGSQDNTAAVVTAFQAAHPQAPVQFLFRNKFNRGLAFNFVEAAFQGRGTYYRAVPGDNVLERRINRADHPRAWNGRCHRSPFRGDSKPTVSAHCLSARYASRQPGERISAGLLQLNPLYRRSHVMRFHVECSGFGYQAEFLTRLISEGATFKERFRLSPMTAKALLR